MIQGGMENCIAPGCVKPAHAKGLCPTHYGRIRTRGSFEAARPHGPPEERFWPKVDMRGTDECWVWKTGKDVRFYPQFWTGKKTEPAHRVSYRLSKGPIPKGAVVMHSCDNMRCVNPAHLSVGSHLDNALDKIAKGRHNPVHLHGSASGMAKLDEETVLRIRADAGTNDELAKKYCVSQTTIWLILNRKTWKHI